MESFKKRSVALQSKEEEARKERLDLENDFSMWLGKQVNWKVFILSHIDSRRSDYPDKNYIYDHMAPRVRGLEFPDWCGVRFEIKVYGETISYNHWIRVVVRDLKEFEDMSGYLIDPEILKRDLEDLEEEIGDLEKEIEEKKKEIERLKTWLDQ